MMTLNMLILSIYSIVIIIIIVITVFLKEDIVHSHYRGMDNVRIVKMALIGSKGKTFGQ